MTTSKFWLFCAVAALSLALTACGGGSTSPSKSVSCELPLIYADGQTAGYKIDPQTQAVSRKFNPSCAITQVQYASVGLCIDHQQISELSAQLILPNATAQTLNLQSAPNTGTCRITGKLYTMTLPSSALQALGSLQGNWTVSVSDNNQVSTTPVGYLVGWSLMLDGTR